MNTAPLLIAPSLLGAALALGVAYISARRRPGPSWPYMVALGIAVASWCLLEIASILSETPQQALRAIRLQYVVIALAPALWHYVALAQTGHANWLKPARASIFLILPVITLGIAYDVLPGLSTLLWRGILVPPEVAVPRALHGPWLWVMLAYIYLLFLGSCALLIEHYSQSPHYHAQLVVAGLIPICMLGVNVVYLSGHWPLATNPTPVGFAFCFALLLWAILRHRLLDLAPIGRGIAFDSLSQGVLILDARERAVDANTAACKLLHRDVAAVLGCSLGELLPCAVLAELIADTREQQFASAIGGELFVELSAVPIQDPVGGCAGAVVILRDNTIVHHAQRELIETQQRLQLANEVLEQMAHTDALTGLANRRQLLVRLEEEFARARRHDKELAMLMIDLDHFKQVNDMRGHLAGDRVLETAGRLLRGITRPADVAARYGGEEFAVLLTDTDAPGAQAAAFRVHEVLRSARHSDAGGGSFQVTPSIGLAMLEPQDRNTDALIARADQALYTAKSAGRDRVCSALDGEFGMSGVA